MKKLIIANWKLNPISLKEVQSLAAKINRTKENTVVLCPPAVFLSQIDYPNLGAQDCFWMDKGPFTGEVSPLQLKKLGIKYCIVGHSERRAVGESEEQINEKIKALLRNKIIPILCVGFGTEAGDDDMSVVDVLRQQLNLGLHAVDSRKVVVAYEPVWAISKGDASNHPVATPQHAEKIALFIKTKYKVRTVIYGGSVNVMNAQSFLNEQYIDGLLVGAESLNPAHFNKIINF